MPNTHWANILNLFVLPTGLEPVTSAFVARRSKNPTELRKRVKNLITGIHFLYNVFLVDGLGFEPRAKRL